MTPTEKLLYPDPTASPRLSVWSRFHRDFHSPLRLLGDDKRYEDNLLLLQLDTRCIGTLCGRSFHLPLDQQLPHGVIPSATQFAPLKQRPTEVATKRYKFEELHYILQSHHVQLFPDTPRTLISRDWVSLKVLALREPLANEGAPTFRDMTFVSQRHLAACLDITSPLDLLASHHHLSSAPPTLRDWEPRR